MYGKHKAAVTACAASALCQVTSGIYMLNAGASVLGEGERRSAC